MKVDKQIFTQVFVDLAEFAEMEFEDGKVKYKDSALKEMRKNLKDAEDGKDLKVSVDIPIPVSEAMQYKQLLRAIRNSEKGSEVTLMINGARHPFYLT